MLGVQRKKLALQTRRSTFKVAEAWLKRVYPLQNNPGDLPGGSGDQAEKVMSVWEGIEQETLRADAQLPQARQCTPLQVPAIKKAQDSMIVDCVVRQGVSLPHLEQAVLTLQPGLSTGSRHTSTKVPSLVRMLF